MPTDEELLQRRDDPFDAWWETKRVEWELLDFDRRDLAWALCREAWYVSRRICLEETQTSRWIQNPRPRKGEPR